MLSPCIGRQCRSRRHSRLRRRFEYPHQPIDSDGITEPKVGHFSFFFFSLSQRRTSLHLDGRQVYNRLGTCLGTESNLIRAGCWLLANQSDDHDAGTSAVQVCNTKIITGGGRNPSLQKYQNKATVLKRAPSYDCSRRRVLVQVSQVADWVAANASNGSYQTMAATVPPLSLVPD